MKNSKQKNSSPFRGVATASFEREIFISFKDYMPTAFFRRIYDMIHTPQKPFDFELFYKGYFFGLEAKHQKSHLDFRRIKKHQLENMSRIEKNGGFSFFLIRIEDTKKYHNKFRAFVISRPEMEKHMELSKKASCNADDLAGTAEFEAKREKLPTGKYTWNIPEFFMEFVK